MAKKQRQAEEKISVAALVPLRDDKVPPVEMWPLDRLVRHPQNRIVNTKTVRFAELLASVKAVGVIEPLTVRATSEPGVLQILSGERRQTAALAAGLVRVPVRNFGDVPDDVAYRMVVVGNLHEDLTPLEEGQRAAALLDNCHGDAAAVASLLGKTASWVVQHAQIARGLSAEWQEEIATATDHEERPKWRAWTAGHLVVLARLPAALQAYWLQKVQKDYRFQSWPAATVRAIDEDVKLDLLYLAKAPFDEGSCSECVNRTDRQPLLWGETVEAATGDKARCLDRKCWDKKTAAALRQEFRDKAEAALTKGGIKADSVVPVSLVEEPDDYYKGEAYRRGQSALKRTFPKLVTADRVEVVTEKTKGAVPGIVVAGKGKGSLRWVKIAEKKESASRGGSPDDYNSPAAKAQREKEERRRALWERACREAWGRIAKAARPKDAELLVCCVYARVDPHFRAHDDRVIKAMRAAYAADPSLNAVVRTYVELCWAAWRTYTKDQRKYCWGEQDREVLQAIGGFFAVDIDKIHNELAAKKNEPAAAKEGTKACVEDCSACQLETCVKTGCAVDQRDTGDKPGKGKRGRKQKRVEATPVEDGVAESTMPDGDLPEDFEDDVDVADDQEEFDEEE